jgi:hypothetical protein
VRHKTVQILQKKWCFGLSNESRRMILLFEDLDELSPYQITLLINRYISISESLQKRTLFYAIQFHVGRTIITVGSLFVSALLSIQYVNTEESAPSSKPSAIFWITWFLSVLVTICNGILTLFKVDKKYYFLHTTIEHLKSETWQYLNLTGKYSGHYLKGQVPNHENQYIFFCNNIEKIKLKQVEEEYYKLIDSHEAAEKDKAMTNQLISTKSMNGNMLIQNQKNSNLIAGLYMPTPEQQTLIDHQQALANALLQNGASLPTQVDGSSNQTIQKE